MIYEKEENGIVQLKFNKYYRDYIGDFRLFGFKEEPKSIDSYKSNIGNKAKLEIELFKIEGNYSTLAFSYEKLNNSKYLGLYFESGKKLDYLSVYIGPEINEESNDLPIWLIILCVILYTIVILVVFYFILRKCGYSKKGETSNEIAQDFSIQPEGK